MANWYNSGNWMGMQFDTAVPYILVDLAAAVTERYDFFDPGEVFDRPTYYTDDGYKAVPVRADYQGMVNTNIITAISSILSGISDLIGDIDFFDPDGAVGGAPYNSASSVAVSIGLPSSIPFEYRTTVAVFEWLRDVVSRLYLRYAQADAVIKSSVGCRVYDNAASGPNIETEWDDMRTETPDYPSLPYRHPGDLIRYIAYDHFHYVSVDYWDLTMWDNVHMEVDCDFALLPSGGEVLLSRIKVNKFSWVSSSGNTYSNTPYLDVMFKDFESTLFDTIRLGLLGTTSGTTYHASEYIDVPSDVIVLGQVNVLVLDTEVPNLPVDCPWYLTNPSDAVGRTAILGCIIDTFEVLIDYSGDLDYV